VGPVHPFLCPTSSCAIMTLLILIAHIVGLAWNPEAAGRRIITQIVLDGTGTTRNTPLCSASGQYNCG
jgi:hypothetical protein